MKGDAMKKLWGVRHVRYWWLRARLLWWFAHYEGPGWHINSSDWAYLDAVWRGDI
jgi:hypothetical protein